MTSRDLTIARWGMPSLVDPGVTYIRNTKSPHWRRWLGIESRYLIEKRESA